MRTLFISQFATSLCGILVLGSAHQAQGNLVANGNFETTTIGPNSDSTYPGGQLGYNVSATGWVTTSYNLLFAAGTADNIVSGGSQGSQGVAYLWGPHDGSANGLPAASPTGGNFVAGFGAFETGPLFQTISGLTIGDSYQLSFWWAGAQQYGFSGTNSEAWQVSLGNQTNVTAAVDNASHGFSGWQLATIDYTATATTEVLSFLAEGTPPVGGPPVSLLDGVDLEPMTPPVPDTAPTALLVGAMGLALMVLVPRLRRQN